MSYLRSMLVVCAMALLCAAGLSAQGRRQGGPPGEPHAPGGPGGPGGAAGPGGRGSSGPGGKGAPSSAATGGNASAASPVSRGVLRLGPAGRWWDNGGVVRTVGLSHEQQRRMDAIFDANKPAIVASYTTLESEKAKLAMLTSSAQVEQSRVFAQIDVVSQARTSLEKATTQMLLQIRGEMKPEQIQKLETVQ